MSQLQRVPGVGIAPQSPAKPLPPADPELTAGVKSMMPARRPAAAPAAPGGGIGVRQSTLDTAGHPPAASNPYAGLPTFQTPVEAPKVPAPVAAQVGVKHEGHPDSPVQAPTAKPAPTANWQTGQAPQWPIQPMPAGSEPFGVASLRLNNRLADEANAAHSPINDYPRIDANNAARLDLYKQYHGGWAPGEYGQLQRQPGGIGVQGGAAPAQDPYRQQLQAQMMNPGASMEGGIGVMRGNAGDGGDGPSVADRNAYSRGTAQNQLAAYDASLANTRRVEGDIHNQDPGVIVNAELNALNTPEGRALAEGKNQMPPGSIPVPATAGGAPAARYNGTNVGPQDKVHPNVQGLHNILHGDMPLHQKVAAAAMIPGIGAPGSPHQELFDAWMARQSSTDERWNHELSQYGNTGPSAENKLADHGWLGRNLFGVTGTGPVQARNQKFHADMARLGYKPQAL